MNNKEIIDMYEEFPFVKECDVSKVSIGIKTNKETTDEESSILRMRHVDIYKSGRHDLKKIVISYTRE